MPPIKDYKKKENKEMKKKKNGDRSSESFCSYVMNLKAIKIRALCRRSFQEHCVCKVARLGVIARVELRADGSRSRSFVEKRL